MPMAPTNLMHETRPVLAAGAAGVHEMNQPLYAALAIDAVAAPTESNWARICELVFGPATPDRRPT
jgi:hypothetical protein